MMSSIFIGRMAYLGYGYDITNAALEDNSVSQLIEA